MQMKFTLLSFIFLITALILLSCAGSRWSSRIAWKDFTLESVPDRNDFPDAGAVILLNDAHLEMFQVEDHAFSEMRHHTIVKILNERGMKYANVLIPYSPGTEVSNIQARTIQPDGRIVPLKKSLIFDTNLYPDYIFYSDIRTKRFTMPAVEEGCIVEYSYHTTVKHFTFWPRWRFQKEDPVLISRYKLRCPGDWDIAWKTYGIDVSPKTGQAYKGMKVSHTWEVRDIPALIPEPAMPNGMQYIPHIMFSPVGIRTWNDVSAWYRQAAGDRMKPGGSIRHFTENLLAGLSDPDEKLQRIYEFVRDHIRYVAIEIGIGGYQPHFAGDVLENRYGDCKDMTTLIVAMAKAADLKVRPVLISTWYHGGIDTGLVSLAHFDHMIAVAEKSDGTRIWMDATEKFSRFGELPWYDCDRSGLVVDGEQAVIYRTPVLTAQENVISRVWHVDIHKHRTWEGRMKFFVHGAPAMELRHRLSRVHVSGIQDFFVRDLLNTIPSANVNKVEVSGTDNLAGPCVAVIYFSSQDTIPEIDHQIVFPLSNFCDPGLHRLYQSKPRKFPISLKYPVQTLDSLMLTFPDIWNRISPLHQDSVVLDLGGFHLSMNGEENKLNWSSRYELYQSSIQSGRYEDFQYLMRRLSLADQVPVVFSVPLIRE